MRLPIPAALAILLLGCPPGPRPALDAGPDASACDHAAQAGEPCAVDCDCCGSACTTEGICAAPCP